MSGIILLPAYFFCTMALLWCGVCAFEALTGLMERHRVKPPVPPPRPRGFKPVVIIGGKYEGITNEV